MKIDILIEKLTEHKSNFGNIEVYTLNPTPPMNSDMTIEDLVKEPIITNSKLAMPIVDAFLIIH